MRNFICDVNSTSSYKHLKNLILFDNPNLTDTLTLSDELIILSASRYNRGTERKREDFVRSVAASEGDPIREYSSYGRTIIKRKEIIYKILGVLP